MGPNDPVSFHDVLEDDYRLEPEVRDGIVYCLGTNLGEIEVDGTPGKVMSMATGGVLVRLGDKTYIYKVEAIVKDAMIRHVHAPKGAGI